MTNNAVNRTPECHAFWFPTRRFGVWNIQHKKAQSLRVSILSVTMLFGHAASADNDLLVGRPFVAVRAQLVRDGWSPRQTYLQLRDGLLERTTGTAAQFYAAGYSEVEVCAGTGFNPCIFNYRKGNRCLRVLTTGENVRSGIVSSVKEECPPSDAL